MYPKVTPVCGAVFWAAAGAESNHAAPIKSMRFMCFTSVRDSETGGILRRVLTIDDNTGDDFTRSEIGYCNSVQQAVKTWERRRKRWVPVWHIDREELCSKRQICQILGAGLGVGNIGSRIAGSVVGSALERHLQST